MPGVKKGTKMFEERHNKFCVFFFLPALAFSTFTCLIHVIRIVSFRWLCWSSKQKKNPTRDSREKKDKFVQGERERGKASKSKNGGQC